MVSDMPPAPRVRISSEQTAMPVPRKRITEVAAFVAAAEKQRLCELDVAVLDAAEMARLNRQHLDHGGATDVISFDLTSPTDDGLCAQVIVCADVAVREARRRGLGRRRELLLYVVHGLLHVMGYDDLSPDEASRMHAREEELIDEFLNNEQ